MKLISLVAWQDKLLALADNGDIYQIQVQYNGEITLQLVMKNPLEGL